VCRGLARGRCSAAARAESDLEAGVYEECLGGLVGGRRVRLAGIFGAWYFTLCLLRRGCSVKVRALTVVAKVICETGRGSMAQLCGHRAHLLYQQSAHAGLTH
jgi:hypothetical protein